MKDMKKGSSANRERNTFGTGKNEVMVNATKAVVFEDVESNKKPVQVKGGNLYSNITNYNKTKGK